MCICNNVNRESYLCSVPKPGLGSPIVSEPEDTRITPAPTRKTPETIGPDPGTPAVPPEDPGPVYTQSPRRRVPRFALKNHLSGRLAARAVTGAE